MVDKTTKIENTENTSKPIPKEKTEDSAVKSTGDKKNVNRVPNETSTNDPGIKPVDKSTNPESLKKVEPKKKKIPEKNMDYLEYPYQIEAPEKEPGTNWTEYFYTEVAPVVKRIAYVRKESNVRDLIRRGWKLIKGELSGTGKKEIPKDPKDNDTGDKKPGNKKGKKGV